MSESVYVIERHDDDWEGPHATVLAGDWLAVVDVVIEQKAHHHADDWETDTGTRGSVVRYLPADGRSGWITVRKEEVRTSD